MRQCTGRSGAGAAGSGGAEFADRRGQCQWPGPFTRIHRSVAAAHPKSRGTPRTVQWPCPGGITVRAALLIFLVVSDAISS